MRSQAADDSGEQMIRLWARLPILLRAVLSGLFVMAAGVWTWPVLLAVAPGLWSIGLMGAFLAGYCLFFSGRSGAASTRSIRRHYFRSLTLSSRSAKLSFLLILLLLAIWQSGMVVVFRIIPFPAEQFLEAYQGINDSPVWLAWLLILMSALVAGICEETGFRGYMQVPLEDRYGAPVAITIVALVFLAVHFHQAWAGAILVNVLIVSVLLSLLAYLSGSLIPAIISHVVVDIINFSYWWTDVAGRFDRQPIGLTGMDLHFIAWTMTLLISIVAFAFLTRRLASLRRAGNPT